MSMSCPMCGRIITKREIDQGRAVTVAEGLLCPECGAQHAQRLQSAPAAKKSAESRPASAPPRAAPAAAPRPAAASARPAPASAPAAARPAASESRPPPAPRAAPASRPAPARPSARARVEEDEEEPAHQHHHYDPRHQKDNVLKYVTIGGLVLLLAGGGFAAFAFKQSMDKAARRESEAAEIAKMEDTIKAMKNENNVDPQAVLT